MSKSRDLAINWARKVMNLDFVVLDLETTGFEYDDEAVSIGLINKNGEALINTLLRHEKKSNPEAAQVHGITWEETRKAPPFTEIWPEFLKATQDKHIVIYNAEFDLRIIEQMIVRYKLPYTPIFRRDTSCAMQEFAAFFGQWDRRRKSYRWQKLSVAAHYFDAYDPDAHDAITDCEMVLAVVRGMAAEKLSTE